MSMKSTPSRYGLVAVTIHWLSALLIIALLVSGFRADNTMDPGAKLQILSIHAPLGIAILALTVLRICWWSFADQKPKPVADTPRWQHASASAVHQLFYVLIAVMSVSGIGLLVMSGATSLILFGVSGQLPEFSTYPPRILHGVGARILMLLLLFHTGGAVYHHLIRKDLPITRIWFRRGDAG